MATPSPPELRSGLLAVGALLLIVGLAVGMAPRLAREVVERRRGGSATRELRDPHAVQAYLAQALAAEGLQRLTSQELGEARRSEVWRAPPATDINELLIRLGDRARQAGVEQHAQVRDELDGQLRTWAGSVPVDEVLLVPSLPADTPPPPPPNRRIRPLLAVVIAGLGDVAAGELVSSPVPLTVAVRPHRPATLRVARDASLAWQEVVADLRSSELSPAAAREAIPFCTGVLLGETAARSLDTLDADSVVIAPGSTSRPPPRALRVEGAWMARQRELADLVARLTHLAAVRGHTTLVIEHDAPALADLLRWAQSTGASRYRLVQASEIARPIETVGGKEERVPPP